MTEPLLNTADVNAVFQKVRGETMMQGVNGAVLANAGNLKRMLQHMCRPFISLLGLRPFLEGIAPRGVSFYIRLHHGLHVPRERNIAVLVALAMTDVYLPTVNVSQFKGPNLALAHSGVIKKTEKGLTQKVSPVCISGNPFCAYLLPVLFRRRIWSDDAESNGTS